MDKIDIDTAALQEQINNINDVVDDLSFILESVKKDTDGLENDWISKTSFSTCEGFKKHYEDFQNAIDTLRGDASFLSNVASGNYEEIDSKTNSNVDNNIAI